MAMEISPLAGVTIEGDIGNTRSVFAYLRTDAVIAIPVKLTATPAVSRTVNVL